MNTFRAVLVCVLGSLLTSCSSLMMDGRGHGHGWRLLGPGEGAYIHDIEFGGDAVWVTSDASGIFKSSDDGRSWTPMNNGLSNEGKVLNSDELVFFNRVPMLQLEIDPNDPRNMYAFSDFAFVHSRNGGGHWSKTIVTQGKDTDRLMRAAAKSYRFCLDPGVSGRIHLMRFSGDFFVSENYGETFERIAALKHDRDLWYGLQQLDYKNLQVDPLSPVDNRTLYYCCGDGFFVSEDGGRNWRKEVRGLAHTEIVGMDTLVQNGHVTIFAAVPGRALRRTVGKRDCGGLYATSKEDGFAWRKLDVEINGAPVDFNSNLHGIVVTDKKAEAIYTANSIGTGPDILRSADFGDTWHPIYVRNIRNPGWIHHPDQVAHIQKLAVNPDRPDEIWLRSWRYGLLKTEDGGGSWENVYSNVKDGKNANRGLHTYWGTSCLPDKLDPDRIYIGLTDFGPCVSNDDGQHWELIHPPGGYDAFTGMRSISDGHVITGPDDPVFEKIPGSGWRKLCVKPDWRAIEFDADDAECFYVSLGLGSRLIGPNKLHRESVLLKTSDRGKSFHFIKPGKDTGLPPFTGFTDLLSLPRTEDSPNELWVAAAWRGVYRSTDGGRTFAKLKEFNELFDLGDYHAARLSADPRDPDRVYLSCGTADWAGAEHTKSEHIYNSRYWIDFKFQDAIPRMIDEDELRVAAQGALWMTPDRGKTWRKLTGDFVNVRNLQVDPFRSDTLYMAVIGHRSGERATFMKGGVYKSLDSGTTWRNVLDQPIVTDIAVHPTRAGWIFAACVGWPGKANPGYAFGTLLDSREMRKAKPGVYLSRDGGETWTDISGRLKNVTHTLNRITLKRWKPGSLFITTSSGILRHDI